MGVNKIVCGAMPGATKIFPDGYFNCSISSPPYWALRDYGVAGQLGLEPTFEEYIDKLCGIYDEVKRVLRDDGTCWVNLGDTYNAGRSGGWAGGKHGMSKPENSPNQSGVNAKNLPAKSLCLIPQRFAIEMVNRGWILRNVLIWHKPNPMPSSAKDRFTVDFEQIFFFVKSKRYWFEPQYEAFLTESNAERPRMGQGTQTKYQSKRGFEGKWKDEDKQSSGQRIQTNLINKRKQTGQHDPAFNPLGRNKRTVWTIPTQPFPEAHFATFPEKLVEPMILSGCPEFVCTKCGKGREKVYDVSYVVDNHNPKATKKYPANGTPDGKTHYGSMDFAHGYSQHHFKGYSDCGCGAGFRPGIVCDPFAEVARPVWSLPKTEGIGLGLSLNRNISKWPNAA